MSESGLLGTIIAIFIVIMAILAFFMPLFVMQIRDKVRSIDRQLSLIVQNLIIKRSVTCPGCGESFEIIMTGKPEIITCPHCSRKYNSDVLRLK